MTALLSDTVGEADGGGAAEIPTSADGTVAPPDAGAAVGGTAIAAI